MITTGQLQAFCSYHGIRPYCRSPFRCEYGIVATNGHVMIVIPDDGRDLEPIEGADIPRSLHKFLGPPPALDWMPVTAIEVDQGYKRPCTDCGGSGKIRMVECRDCDGNGSFWRGAHRYECEECGGNGSCPQPTNDGDGEGTEECQACEGGICIDMVPIQVQQAHFQARYLDLLKALPGCEIATQSANEYGYIRFDGGRGAIMPMRTREHGWK